MSFVSPGRSARKRRFQKGLWWGASLVVHGVLAGWLLHAPEPLKLPQEPPIVELELIRPVQPVPPPSPRPYVPPRARPPRLSPPASVPPLPLAPAVTGEIPAGVATAPGAGDSTSAGGPAEDRWKLPDRLKNREIVRAALRKAQPSRLCNGALDGVLSTDEKAFCYEVYWGRGAAKAEAAKRLSKTP